MSRLLNHAAAAILAVLLAGCGTTRNAAGRAEETNRVREAAPAREEAAALPAIRPFRGDIVRVNLPEGYVIAKCAVLPSGTRTYTVYRGFHRVAVIRFTGIPRRPYAAADILEGMPRAGDRVQE